MLRKYKKKTWNYFLKLSHLQHRAFVLLPFGDKTINYYLNKFKECDCKTPILENYFQRNYRD